MGGGHREPGNACHPSSNASPELSVGLNRAAHFGEPLAGSVVFAQKCCGERWP